MEGDVRQASPTARSRGTAVALHETANRAYEWHFLRGLKRRIRRKAELFPAVYKLDGLAAIGSIRAFDDAIVAPHSGFRDADDYYDRAASSRVVDRIAVPTLIVSAKDDPFIRLLPATRARLLGNPHITYVETRHGGHCAFLGQGRGDEIHWAEATVVRYLQSVAPNASLLSESAAAPIKSYNESMGE